MFDPLVARASGTEVRVPSGLRDLLATAEREPEVWAALERLGDLRVEMVS